MIKFAEQIDKLEGCDLLLNKSHTTCSRNFGWIEFLGEYYNKLVVLFVIVVAVLLVSL